MVARTRLEEVSLIGFTLPEEDPWGMVSLPLREKMAVPFTLRPIGAPSARTPIPDGSVTDPWTPAPELEVPITPSPVTLCAKTPVPLVDAIAANAVSPFVNVSKMPVVSLSQFGLTPGVHPAEAWVPRTTSPSPTVACDTWG